MGDFHLWPGSPTLAEFHRTPTSCRASEYNPTGVCVPHVRFLSLFSPCPASTWPPFVSGSPFSAPWNTQAVCCAHNAAEPFTRVVAIVGWLHVHRPGGISCWILFGIFQFCFFFYSKTCSLNLFIWTCHTNFMKFYSVHSNMNLHK